MKNLQKKIIAQTNALIELAMITSCEDKYHLSVEYHGHVNWVEVRMTKVLFQGGGVIKYSDRTKVVIEKYISLKNDDALEKLLAVKDEIIDLLSGETEALEELEEFSELEDYEPVTRRGQDNEDYCNGISLESL